MFGRVPGTHHPPQDLVHERVSSLHLDYCRRDVLKVARRHDEASGAGGHWARGDDVLVEVEAAKLVHEEEPEHVGAVAQVEEGGTDQPREPDRLHVGTLVNKGSN